MKKPSDRKVPSEEGSDYAKTLIASPDSSVHRLLFPDYSQWDPNDPPPPPAGVRLGHFEIVDRIGSGGMGSVFLATDLHLQRYVALKILSPSQAAGETSIQRFINEARAAARLDYDGIARVFYYGEDKGFHFIAFEYVTGINIRNIIQSRGALPPMEALNYVLQLAHALKHTSAAGVVHRDIKPSNIIVGPSGRAKLVDLGLARKESTETIDELTVAGTTLGTFDYISPEQAQDPRNVDIRSDIYSLGCTLYHMLTGEPPYPDGTVAQKLLEHQRESVPDPSRKNRKVSSRLAAITQKMMASDPAKRHQTPESLVRELLQVAEHEGLQGVTTEGLVWSGHHRRFGREWMIRHASWISAAAILLAIVFLLDYFTQSPHEPLEPLASGTGQAGAEDESTTASQTAMRDRDESHDSPTDDSSAAPRVPLDIAESVRGSLPPSGDGTGTTEILDPFRPFGNDFDPLNLFPPLTVFDEEGEAVSPLAPENSAGGTSERTGDSKPPRNTQEPEANGVRELPVVMRSSSGQESTYQTLEAACAEARDGSRIELRYNGRREGAPEKPILINADLTIRAAPGYHPVISFESSENPDPNDARMITLQGGSLDLEGVELEIDIRHSLRDVAKDEWVVFSLPEAEKLRLHDVVITLRNAQRYQPAAFIRAGKGSDLDRMKLKSMPPVGTTEGVIPFEIEISRSVFRGEADGILLENVRPGLVQVNETLFLLENSLFANRGSSDMPDEFSDLKLSLSHVTCVTGNAPFRLETGQIPREVLPLEVEAKRSLFYLGSIGLAPFVSMSGETNASDFSESFGWNGTHNWYRGFQVFRTITDSLGFSSIEDLDFELWREYWNSEDRGYEENPVSQQIAWREPWQDKPFSELSPLKFQLDLSRIEDPRVFADDGQPVGANVERLPLPLDIRSLKKPLAVEPPPLSAEPDLED
jgi:eukaryotic-like serine/threonine-protein kinase